MTIPVIEPGDVVFVRTYIPTWLGEQMNATDEAITSEQSHLTMDPASIRRLEQLRKQRSALIEESLEIRDMARERLESLAGVTVVDISLGPDWAPKFGKPDSFPEVVAIYRGTRDKVAEFGPFAKRYLARRGKVSAEEMAALYEDFHGVELKKEDTEK